MARLFFHGQPVRTCGQLPKVGAPAPDFWLANSQLHDISLAAYGGQFKLLATMPSLDAPTCAASARALNEQAARLPDTVVLLVSADLPFAQCRFCESGRLDRVVALSSFRSAFAEDYGLKIIDGALAGLLARAMVLIDPRNQVVHTELVSEITQEPDYQAALAAVGMAR